MIHPALPRVINASFVQQGLVRTRFSVTIQREGLLFEFMHGKTVPLSGVFNWPFVYRGSCSHTHGLPLSPMDYLR